jgi:hypothetical protein
LENRSRTRGPPIVTCTVCRSVLSARTTLPCVNGAGGMLAGSVSWGAAVQVPTQCPGALGLPAASRTRAENKATTMAAQRATALISLKRVIANLSNFSRRKKLAKIFGV